MPEVYRESRTYTRGRDDPSSDDDDNYKGPTVRRYKVTPNRVERVERVERDFEVDDDRRSRYSSNLYPGRTSGDLLDVDRRSSYVPERARSAIDSSPRDDYYNRNDRPRNSYVEKETKVIEREDPYADPRSRTVVERQVIERDRDDDFRDDRERSRTVVYEKSKEIDRVERGEPYSPRDWDRHSRMPWDRGDDRETDVRIERRVEERREDGGHHGGGEVERYRKETEYYEPAPIAAPIVIRQRAPEQKIIVQEAPAAPPIVFRETRPETREDEYYYRRESREVGPYRGDRREEDYAMERYERRRGDRRDRHYSDGEGSEDDYYVKRTVTRRRDRSGSGSPDHHHKRHLAEGALAGAGISALLASRRGGNGELPENRGRKVIAGAALGALGTEAVRRARSAYQERFGDDGHGRSRSRSRSRHSRIKTGLGIAAVALAAAGAAKYYQSNKIDKEEMSRGRSRRRYSNDYSRTPSRTPSRKRSKSRVASVAKAAVGTAAVAGLVKHFRDKSKGRNNSKSRSRSRLRTGAEIVAAGLAGAAGKKLYDRHHEKKERERELDSEEEYEREEERRNRHRSRSRSLSRSARSPFPEASTADPELGMVEYGTQPLYVEPPYPQHGHGSGAGGARDYDSAAEESRSHRRHRNGHHRSRSSDSESSDKEVDRKRSRSRLRNVAAGAAAAGAAAIGIKKYRDNKKAKARDDDEDEEEDRRRKRTKSSSRSRSRSRSRQREQRGDLGRDRDHGRGDRERERERERRRYEDETSADGYDPYDIRRTPSPPHASGGAYYPPPGASAAMPATHGFTQHPNAATTNLAEPPYPLYTPDYTGYPPPPPGPPPNSAATASGFPPPPTGPDHVSADSSRSGRPQDVRPKNENQDGVDHVSRSRRLSSDSNSGPPTPTATKSVAFIPLSPQSSRTLRQHRLEQEAHETDKSGGEEAPNPNNDPAYHHHRRRLSDPSSNRPLLTRRRPHNSSSPDSDPEEEDVIEVLPDRFDSQGRPLGRHAWEARKGWHSRRGDFVYNRGRDGDVRGLWSVAGTDGEAVDRIVRDLVGAVGEEGGGRGGWLGLVGGLLGAGRGLLEGRDGTAAKGRDDDGRESRARRG
ncbi:hypothetical protein QBC33DRAFT_597404 [Phialemonium atrogriseum]|uniref:DUF3824 domain-containing protein n=1 Tax=Phialemonium atrogriseum TaxID=1093897 RepID=A0AAJ0C8E7_9PEZI|nr:uncharacterized protein QBC33DRAFT_597404 [Phialemonium atrogriseum]KAK1770883.1 hypothetical protein QBC33DRAFT_597404 [Phialemonium atrogriseum]